MKTAQEKWDACHEFSEDLDKATQWGDPMECNYWDAVKECKCRKLTSRRIVVNGVMSALCNHHYTNVMVFGSLILVDFPW